MIPADALVAAVEASLSMSESTAWLGITAERGAGGVVVSAVDEDSPAAVSGVTVGDVIVGFEDRPVLSLAELALDMAGHTPATRSCSRSNATAPRSPSPSSSANAPPAPDAIPAGRRSDVSVAGDAVVHDGRPRGRRPAPPVRHPPSRRGRVPVCASASASSTSAPRCPPRNACSLVTVGAHPAVRRRSLATIHGGLGVGPQTRRDRSPLEAPPQVVEQRCQTVGEVQARRVPGQRPDARPGDPPVGRHVVDPVQALGGGEHDRLGQVVEVEKLGRGRRPRRGGGRHRQRGRGPGWSCRSPPSPGRDA